MYIDANSIKINDTYMGEYITSVRYGYHKLWGNDTGRNSLDGTFSGTLKGVFPKFTLRFRRLTKTELETLAPILDSASQQFTYYDPNLKTEKTLTTYTGDWEIENKGFVSDSRRNDGFEMSFISMSRR